MFRNVGKKIKGLAIVICVINILFSIVLALLICNNTEQKFIVLLLIFIGIVSLGILFGWLASVFVYAFGQLVDNSDIIVATLCASPQKNEDMEKEFAKEFLRDKNSTMDEPDFESKFEATLYIPSDLK